MSQMSDVTQFSLDGLFWCFLRSASPPTQSQSVNRNMQTRASTPLLLWQGHDCPEHDNAMHIGVNRTAPLSGLFLLDFIRDPFLLGLIRDPSRMLRQLLRHIEMNPMVVRLSPSMIDWLDPPGP